MDFQGINMKRLQKITLIFVAAIVTCVTIINYIYQQITPRVLGESEFPLREKWSLCVDEQIQEISSDGNEKILVKTNKALSAYDLDSGNLIWMTPIKGQRESFPSVIVGERVFVSDKDQLWAFDLKTGRALWKSPLDSADTWVPDASEKFVLLNSISDRIDVYDAESGGKLWGIPGGRGYTQAYIDDNTVYIVDRGVKALDAVTGDILWELDNSRATGFSTFGSGIIYYMEYPGDETFDLIAYNAKSRKELWRVNFPDNSPSRLYLYNRFLFMTENEALYQIASENGETKWQKALSAPTNLSFIGNNVYVLELFSRIIHTLNIENGNELGSLQVAPQRILGTETQEMVSIGTNLVFSRGCEVFVYGD